MKILIIQGAFLLPDDFEGNARDGLRAIADYGDSLEKDGSRKTPNTTKDSDFTEEQRNLLGEAHELLYERIWEMMDGEDRFVGNYSHATWDEENEKWIQFDYDGYPLKEEGDEDEQQNPIADGAADDSAAS